MKLTIFSLNLIFFLKFLFLPLVNQILHSSVVYSYVFISCRFDVFHFSIKATQNLADIYPYNAINLDMHSLIKARNATYVQLHVHLYLDL